MPPGRYSIFLTRRRDGLKQEASHLWVEKIEYLLGGTIGSKTGGVEFLDLANPNPPPHTASNSGS